MITHPFCLNVASKWVTRRYSGNRHMFDKIPLPSILHETATDYAQFEAHGIDEIGQNTEAVSGAVKKEFHKEIVSALLTDRKDIDYKSGDVCGVLVQYPSTEGMILDYGEFIKKAHANEVKVVRASDFSANEIVLDDGDSLMGIDEPSSQTNGFHLEQIMDELELVVKGTEESVCNHGLIPLNCEKQNSGSEVDLMDYQVEHVEFLHCGTNTSGIVSEEVPVELNQLDSEVFHVPESTKGQASDSVISTTSINPDSQQKETELVKPVCPVSGSLPTIQEGRGVLEKEELYGHQVDEVVVEVEPSKVVDSGVEIGVDANVAHEQLTDIVITEKAGDVVVDEDARGHVKPDVVTFSTLIRCVSVCSWPQKSVELFKRMPSLGCEPDQNVSSSMIYAYARTGNVDMALKLYDATLLPPPKPPDRSNTQWLISLINFYANFGKKREFPAQRVSRFITDSRYKVREQSRLFLRDVLVSFQKSSLLASASEGVQNILDRFLLLAGRANVNANADANNANSNAGKETMGAQQVLYILDALKECFPLLSLTYKTSILKHLKSLLVLRQPLVTKRITNCLNFLFLNPESEVSPEALLEVLCSLSTLFTSSNVMSGDGITFNTRLLDAGMKKVFSLNRHMCVIKLPSIFNDLKDILASEHEEAIFATADALKSMINYCIDETLIKQGVDQITLDESRMSGPTIIERICAIVESLLDYHYVAAWDRVFDVVSAMFHKLGSNSPYFMRGILKHLEDMQKLPDEDFSVMIVQFKQWDPGVNLEP